MKITKYPAPGMLRIDKTILADTLYLSIPLNTQRYSGYRFDHENELLSGTWEIEFWYNRNKIISQKFNVVYEN
jgi:hypothetical protein